MTDPPLCRCHSEQMEWNKDPRYVIGGYWRCKVKHQEGRARYEASEKGRENRRRYGQSPMGALKRQLWEMTRVRVRY